MHFMELLLKQKQCFLSHKVKLKQLLYTVAAPLMSIKL